jgi:hypothetical protein
MFLLLIALMSPVAQADSIHLPAEMREKVDAASEAISDGVRAAKHSVNHASEHSDLTRAILSDLGKLWSGMKTQSRHAVVYLDHQLHEHVIGPDSAHEER